MRRLVCLLAAVCFSVGSAAAWDAESFVGLDDPLYYDYAPVVGVSAVSPFSSDSSGVTKVTSFDFSYDAAFFRYYTVRYKPPLSGTFRVPQSSGVGRSGSISTASSHVNLYTSHISFSAVDSSSSQDVLGYDPLEVLSSSINLSVPIDNPDGATAIAIDLFFPLSSFALHQLSPSSSSSSYYTPDLVELYVDDLLIRSYSSPPSWTLSETDIYFSSSSPIRSVNLRFRYPVFSFDTADGAITFRGEYYFQRTSSLSYSLLSSDDVLNGWNDQAQDNLNKHEEYESQWVGTMTENFNNLHLSDFRFPVGLVSGFSLLTGIFQDLWNGMGEYRILYVFPLTLAVVLLLIGRLAKDTIKGPQRAPKNKGGGPRA